MPVVKPSRNSTVYAAGCVDWSWKSKGWEKAVSWKVHDNSRGADQNWVKKSHANIMASGKESKATLSRVRAITLN